MAKVIGLIAAVLASMSNIPQVVVMWNMRPKPAETVSLWTFSILLAAATLFLIYGFLKRDLPIKLCNTAVVITTVAIIAYKLIYG